MNPIDFRAVFAPRRARLMAGMGAGAAIVPTSPERLRNRDTGETEHGDEPQLPDGFQDFVHGILQLFSGDFRGFDNLGIVPDVSAKDFLEHQTSSCCDRFDTALDRKLCL